MEVLKNVNPNGLKKCESKELMGKADRPLGGGNALYSKGITVLSSADIYEKQYNIGGEIRKGIVFLGAAYDENGKFVKAVEVSPNSFTRELCPEQGNAVGSIQQVENCSNYGNTIKEIVGNMLTKKLAIFKKETRPLGAPNWIQSEQRMDYSNMIFRDRTVYEIRECPEKIWKDLFGE